MTRSQSEKDIQSLTGLSGIRAKPSMYAGSSDSEGMWTAIREPLDNCMDEAFAGRNNSVTLVRSDKHEFWIADSGGGIPVGPITVDDPLSHKRVKLSALKAIVSLTHTGGKFDQQDADGQRGTHGVGIKLTNAVASLFEVWTYRSGWHYTRYQKGKLVTDVSKAKAPNPDWIESPPTKGTFVHVVLDPTVFDKGSEVDTNTVLNWFEMSAAFSSKVSFDFYDGGDWHSWSSSGAEGYLAKLMASEKAVALDDNCSLIQRGKFWDLALSFTNYDGAGVRGFVNGLPNVEGGTHVSTVYSVISKVVSEYAKRGLKFTPSDLRDGLFGVVNMRLTGCKFHNQAKSKLVDERATEPFAEELEPLVREFFKKRKALAELLCERASKLADLKSEFQQNKRVARALRTSRLKNKLPAKLAVSSKCTNEERELYIVEGDSAGGSAKQARDSSFQEVLPLKGKILNAYGTKASAAIESEEVLNLLTAIGYDPSLEKPFENLRVGKVIILTDGDVDGSHIQNLVLATLVRFVPNLINESRVFCALPYEFMVQWKGRYLFSEKLEELLERVPESVHGNVMHLKGLGEISAPVLSEMAFDVKTRRLVRLTPLDKKQVRRVADLAGTDNRFRKELLGVA